MNIIHLDAFAKTLGFDSLEALLQQQYGEKGQSLDAIAFDLGISIMSVRKYLAEFGIRKPERKIPITKAEAKRLGPDQIAKAHGVSRATAWRWKRVILGTDDAKA